MSVFPHRPDRSIPLTEAGPGVPTLDAWLVRPEALRAGHDPSPRERLILARHSLSAARALLGPDLERAAREVRRAHREVRSVLSSPGDDLVETLLLVEDELAHIAEDLEPPPSAA